MFAIATGRVGNTRDVFILSHNVFGTRKNIVKRRTFIREKVRIITRYGQKLN